MSSTSNYHNNLVSSITHIFKASLSTSTVWKGIRWVGAAFVFKKKLCGADSKDDTVFETED